MDNVTAIKFFQLLRSQQILISDLSLEVQSLIDCLRILPDFEQSRQKQKEAIQREFLEARKIVLEDIDSMIRALKKSNGGA